MFCFCAQRAFPHNGLLHVTKGAHQQKVKALITWIKGSWHGNFLKIHPSFNRHVREEKRFQSLQRREQFYVAYKNHYSLHSWQHCKIIWLKGGNGASFNNNSSQFISTKLPFSNATQKISLVALPRGNFSSCASYSCILTSSRVHKGLWLLLLASSWLWLPVKLVLQCCIKFVFQKMNIKAFIP